MFYKILIRLLILLGVFTQLWNQNLPVHAQSVDDLKAKISSKNDEIKNIEAEINRLDKEVKNTQITGQTLNTELKQADAIKKRLDVDIKLTIKKIDVTSLNITSIESNIVDKNAGIDSGQAGISESLRLINEAEKYSLLETILSGANLSTIWSQISELETLQNETAEHIQNLKFLKKELQDNKIKLETERTVTAKLKGQLADQRKIALQTIQTKNKLITDTKNKESNFKKLLAESEIRKAAVGSELLQYESELKITLDQSKIPVSGTKVLSWPLDSTYITQYFGLTEFSKTQPIYNGRGHNGIDLRASIGTALRASAAGIVLGTGDTDPICYGASYGKWIMIDHENGLATIYGHLSLSKVYQGQRVDRGELIGYTGRSGYAIGPHLHFTVAATQAIKIGNLKSKVKGCGTYTIPLGPFNGYLNPLLYL
ncbi:MAG: peptidoglycan DD-metalloendopeptidase family protein [Candidatus Vogelbacteria bacterium]|nr:peptidoglycan DD-metalloendopeptidase family protein [Candidatus Vogelbacteria bacterium]